MARKDCTPEQAIGMLREAEVRLSQGQNSARSVVVWGSPSRATIAGGAFMAA